MSNPTAEDMLGSSAILRISGLPRRQVPMDWALYISAFIVLITGVAHSALGEKYILVRLFRRTDIPHLFGGPEFTVRTLRFAWHITTVAWWGLGALIILVARDQASPAAVLYVLSCTALASAVVAAVGSRLRHLSWLAFLAVAVLLFMSAAQRAPGVGA